MSRRARRVLRLTLLLAALWAAVAVGQVIVAYLHLRAGEAAAEAVRGDIDAARLRSGELQAGVEEAHDRFRRAQRLLSGPVLAPVRLLPFAGRQTRAVASMAGAAAQAAGTGIEPLAEARRLVVEPPEDDGARLAAVRRMAVRLQHAATELRAIDMGPGEALLTPIAARRRNLAGDIADLQRRIDDAAAVATGAADLLGGPRRYLLFAANNAEMRAGSGMFLSVGTISFDEGEMTIGAVEPTAALVLDRDDVPPIDGDLAARWGWLEPNRDFRNLAATPRFDVSADLALRMWEARTGERLDGVLAVDAAALAAVLRAAGPVTVDDVRLNARRAVDFVLNDQYTVLGTDAAREQAERRDVLGRLARAAFQRVADGDADLVDLTEGLARAARGRHLLAWSRHAEEQDAWTTAGISGSLTADSFGVMLLNRGGNKLDYFLNMRVEVEAVPQPDGRAVTVSVVLENDATGDEVPYVAGPHPAVDAAPGEYVGLLAVTLPADARRSRFDGDRALAVAGSDGPARVVATEVRVPPGGRLEVVLTTELAADRTSVTLEPSARIPPVRWRSGDDRFTDDRRRDIVLE